MAWEAFRNAPSEYDIAALATRFHPFRDPEFVAQITGLIARADVSERAGLNKKLAALKSLPPDHEAIAFRQFTNAASLEAIKEAALRYPHLTHETYHAHIDDIICTTFPQDEQAALFQIGDILRPRS